MKPEKVMKASTKRILDTLKIATQLKIPIYQRMYSWKEYQCQQLWNDIIRCGRDNDISNYFIGSVIYVANDLFSPGDIDKPFFVIDGQQRLTTITLLIAALVEIIGDREPLEGFNHKDLKNNYLINPKESGDKSFKLILSQSDRNSLKAIIKGEDSPKDKSICIYENFEFFKTQLKKLDDLKVLCEGLTKLIIVEITLDNRECNPQLIFEGMNSTGMKLSQGDLIRNYLLMRCEEEYQNALYEDYWHPMELEFESEYYEKFDDFMRLYLTIKTHEIPKREDVYETFKQYFKSSGTTNKNIEDLLKDIKNYANYYCIITFKREKDNQLKLAFENLHNLRIYAYYPFLLELYADFSNNVLSRDDFLSAISIIESYLFRRAICNLPSNSLNKFFARLSIHIKKDHYIESMKDYFLSLSFNFRFPSDEEFHKKIQTKNLYHFRSNAYLLYRIENFNRKESVNGYTIEHILPQVDNKADKLPLIWREELGEEWERVWRSYRHTLGNLTLTGYNPEYSNKSFKEKCDHEWGFKQSPLVLNEKIAEEKRWDESAIQRRAKKLADKALKVWKNIDLPENISKTYNFQIHHVTGYSLSDHPYLIKGKMAEVYKKFREAVLNLDPCVVEEVKKLYVAFKAKTNFVDVVPQAKRLCLTLNLTFPEIDDPCGICRDVTTVGRWGNGDVEVSLRNVNEIPQIMALVTQAFKKQTNLDNI